MKTTWQFNPTQLRQLLVALTIWLPCLAALAAAAAAETVITSTAVSGVSPSTANKMYFAGYTSGNDAHGSIRACPYAKGKADCEHNPDWSAEAWLDPSTSQTTATTTTTAGAGGPLAGPTKRVPLSYLSHHVRQIITSSRGNTATAAGVKFQINNLSATEQARLNINPINQQVDALGTNRVDYLRGDSSHEISHTGGLFRARSSSKLGDIVNSGLVYVGAPASMYTGQLYPGYANFIHQRMTRTPMLYAGANDGMLHAFEAASGKEVFAYLPNYFLQADPSRKSARITTLSLPKYPRQAYVDATPMVGDININGNWTTVLSGGYGAGGKGFYALNVTDPNKFSSTMNAQSNAGDIFMWELSDATEGSGDIGYTWNQPVTHPASSQPLQYALIPTQKPGGHQWAIIVGNGYGSTNGHAVLYFLNPANGAILFKVPVETTSGSNGLSTPYPVSRSGSGIVDTVWAGDLQGTLWRIQWNGSAWISAPLFSAGPTQPITAAPCAMPNPDIAGAWQVIFGTGRYLNLSNNLSHAQQSLYGIVDNFASAPVKTSQLVTQTFISSTAANLAGDFTRSSSSYPIDYKTQKGWRILLPASNGERITANPVIPPDTSAAVFSSFAPASSTQVSTGYLTILNAWSGAAYVANTGAAISSRGTVGMENPQLTALISSSQAVIIHAGAKRYSDNSTSIQMPQMELTIPIQTASGIRFSWHTLP